MKLVIEWLVIITRWSAWSSITSPAQRSTSSRAPNSSDSISHLVPSGASNWCQVFRALPGSWS